ncbi:hypothetical protein ACJX0J_034291, partial [Zea mays]
LVHTLVFLATLHNSPILLTKDYILNHDKVADRFMLLTIKNATELSSNDSRKCSTIYSLIVYRIFFGGLGGIFLCTMNVGTGTVVDIILFHNGVIFFINIEKIPFGKNNKKEQR